MAVAYAVRHPERVRRLVISTAMPRAGRCAADPAEIARREAMLTLTEIGWGADNPAYRQLFTNIYIPEATPQADGLVQRDAAAVGVARECRAAAAGAWRRSTCATLLPKVRTPTLIFHSRDDQAVPFAQGEELAAGIPGARFMPLESRNHILLETEPAWRDVRRDQPRVPRQRRRAGARGARRRGAAEPVDERANCTGSDGARIAYARQRRGLSAGQGAQLDDPPRP